MHVKYFHMPNMNAVTAPKPVPQKSEWFATSVYKLNCKCVKPTVLVAVWDHLEQQAFNLYIGSIPSHWQPIINKIPQAEKHQPSPAEVPQQQADYKAKPMSSCARSCRKHDTAISTNTCTHLARANSLQGCSITCSVTEICSASIPSSCCSSTHWQGRCKQKKGATTRDGSSHWEMQCTLKGCFKNTHSAKLTAT